MGLLNWFSNFNNKPLSVERDNQGSWFYEIFNNKTNYNDCQIDQYALKTVINKISQTGKLANINLYENGKLKENNYLYYYQNKPNTFQTWTDFIEEYLVRISLGTVYLYKNKIGSFNAHYFLDYKDFDQKTKQYIIDFGRKLIMSENKPKENHIVIYGKDKQPIKLSDIIIIHNEPPLVNWFKNENSLKALRKVVSNSESALDSKNINLHFSQKFLAFQKQGKDDLQLQINGLSGTERNDLTNKLMSKQSLHVSGKTDIELKRFVENMKAQGLDETFIQDLILVSIYFDVPIELIYERGKGLSSQGEAKEKAFVQFVTMCLQPKLQKLTDVLELTLNENQEVKAEFNHLPFMSVIRKQKAEELKLNLEALKLMQELGIDIKDKLNEIRN